MGDLKVARPSISNSTTIENRKSLMLKDLSGSPSDRLSSKKRSNKFDAS